MSIGITIDGIGFSIYPFLSFSFVPLTASFIIFMFIIAIWYIKCLNCIEFLRFLFVTILNIVDVLENHAICTLKLLLFSEKKNSIFSFVVINCQQVDFRIFIEFAAQYIFYVGQCEHEWWGHSQVVFVFRIWYTVVYILIGSALLRYRLSLIPIDPDGVTNYTIRLYTKYLFEWFVLLFIHFKCETGCEEKISLKIIQ